MRVVDPKPVRYGFLLLPNYSMIAVSSAVEVLRMANQLGRQEFYQWPTYTMDGSSVLASNGLEIMPGNKMADAGHLDVLFVCSGMRVQEQWSDEISRQLHKFKSRHTVLGGLCTGTYILAQAGLLKGYRCTIHWENIASLREMSPEIITTEELFEIDRDRYTAAGGTAPLDMMLQVVKKVHGNQLAVSISEQFMCDRMRGSYDKQRIPLKLLVGTNQPKLTEAVALMESNLEELVGLDDLASLVGISRRQLERLFKKYLDCVPRRYYLDLRLKKARQLLLQTDKSIAEVAIACGFVSAPHFSKSYRDRYNVSPRDERQLRRDKLS
jgi:transcriptional regulator GlxA family with amidase domain